MMTMMTVRRWLVVLVIITVVVSATTGTEREAAERDDQGIVFTLISKAIDGVTSVISYTDTQKSKRSASAVLGRLSKVPYEQASMEIGLRYIKAVLHQYSIMGFTLDEAPDDSAALKTAHSSVRSVRATRDRVIKEAPRSSTLDNLGKSTTEAVKDALADNAEAAGKEVAGAVLGAASGLLAKAIPGVNVAMSSASFVKALRAEVKYFDSGGTSLAGVAKFRLAECAYISDIVSMVDAATKKIDAEKDLASSLAYQTLRIAVSCVWNRRCRDVRGSKQPTYIQTQKTSYHPTDPATNDRKMIMMLKYRKSHPDVTSKSPAVVRWLKVNGVRLLSTPVGYRVNVVLVRCIVQQDSFGNDDVIIRLEHDGSGVEHVMKLGEFNSKKNDVRNQRHMFVPLNRNRPWTWPVKITLQEVDSESSSHDFLGSVTLTGMPLGKAKPTYYGGGDHTTVHTSGGIDENGYQLVKIHFNSDEDGGSIFTDKPSYYVYLQIAPVWDE